MKDRKPIFIVLIPSELSRETANYLAEGIEESVKHDYNVVRVRNNFDEWGFKLLGCECDCKEEQSLSRHERFIMKYGSINAKRKLLGLKPL